MKQRCQAATIYLNCVLLAAVLGYFMAKGEWWLVAAWFVVLPAAGWAYIRYSPQISRFTAYDPGDDKRAFERKATQKEVTFYTALGCPFCPVVKERLIALRDAMGFELNEIDVTLKPGVLIAKEIRELPVVECGAWRLEGNATSERLANLIAGSNTAEPVAAGVNAVRTW